MKICLACLVFLAACGGSPVDEPTSRTVAVPAPSSSSSEPVAASTSDETGSTETVASPSTSAGTGVCTPDAVCGGLTQCQDNCYGARCCYLSCSCSSGDPHDADAHLRCSLSACNQP